MKQRISITGHQDRTWTLLNPRLAAAPASDYIVRPLRGDEELAAYARARRRAFVEFGLVGNDAPLDVTRRFATALGVFSGTSLVAGVSVWRLSDSFCSLGFLLAGVGIERYPASRVIEVGGLFVAGAHRSRGVARHLLAATRVLLAGIAPELVVAFVVEREAQRFVERWGFSAVGPAAAHPFSPAVRVVPLVASLEAVLAAPGEPDGGVPGGVGGLVGRSSGGS